MRAVLLTVVLGLSSACRVHPLNDGDYAFTVGRVIRDDCNLAAQPNLIGKGTLATQGNQVNLSLTSPTAELVGTYRSNVEQMVLDGTIANFQTVVRSQECLVDVVSLHLDTETVDATHFKGAMSVEYDARTPDTCVCKFWFDFTAAK
jgi:hypothetical protein